jgi:hypothetical protein
MVDLEKSVPELGDFVVWQSFAHLNPRTNSFISLQMCSNFTPAALEVSLASEPLPQHVGPQRRAHPDPGAAANNPQETVAAEGKDRPHACMHLIAFSDKGWHTQVLITQARAHIGAIR